MTRLIIGSRGSQLALTQTHWAADRMRQAHPGLEIIIKIIQTQGDASQAANIPLASFGEKGIFAKELESALLDRTIDLAVHSMKDMPHTLPAGLGIAAIPLREDPRDALLGMTLDQLPQGARVGTGSVRRRALLLSRRPDLHLLEIRGNIDSRVRKLQSNDYDAICLAVAGLNRLNLQGHITEILDPNWFTPDPGQGALCLENREADLWVRDLTFCVHDASTAACVHAERAFLQQVGGSCKSPVGAFAQRDSDTLTMTGMVAAPDGSLILREALSVPAAQFQFLGEQIASRLKAAGGDGILKGSF